jgi:hypothetical protein
MNGAAEALLSGFESAARTAQEAETAFRKTVAAQIARLEREREIAFRRTRLIRLLAGAAAGFAKEDEAVGAQSLALAEEFGWAAGSEAHKAILEEMKPLAVAIWQCVCETETGAAEAVGVELANFEAWFEATRGSPFYALFDQYVPEVPLVDF